MGLVYWKNKEGLNRLKDLHSQQDHSIATSDIHQLPKNLFLVDLLKSSFSQIDSSIFDSKRMKNEFETTDRIQCWSNFLASILLGDYASIDVSDASRMNLLDLNERQWLEENSKIFGPHFVYPRTIVGTIANYFIDRYGFKSDCQIVSFTNEFSSSYYALAANVKTVVINLGIRFI